MKKNIICSIVFTAILGMVESQGAETEKTKIDYKSWECVSENSLTAPSFEYQIRKFPEGFNKAEWIKGLNPTCSILMDNGAQIDYDPWNKVAVWIVRDEGQGDLARLTHVITGTFNKMDAKSLASMKQEYPKVKPFANVDIYDLDAKQFSLIIRGTKTVFCGSPVFVTYLDSGSLPIAHPQDEYDRVIKEWFEHK